MNLSQHVKSLEKQLAGLKALQELKSAEQVVDFLIAKKIKGEPGDSYSCPIATYLRTIDWDTTVEDDGNIPGQLQAMDDIQLPPPFAKFIKEFDNLSDFSDEEIDKKKLGKYTKLLK